MNPSGEIAALVKIAELDAGLLDTDELRRAPLIAHERRKLAARLSSETLEAYSRALRAGRRPAVVRLAANVCSGCHMRLHAMLEQRVRKGRGVGACPHCLRLVYDPAWLPKDDVRR